MPPLENILEQTTVSNNRTYNIQLQTTIFNIQTYNIRFKNAIFSFKITVCNSNLHYSVKK